MGESTMRDFVNTELDAPFLFQRRPLSLPEDLRPSWRIGLLVLLLSGCCRGGKSSRSRLHVLSWSVRNQESLRDLLAAISGDLNPRSLIVRVDPFLDRALDFAVGEGLIEHLGGKALALSATGKKFASEIKGDAQIFVVEKTFIEAIQQRVTEDLVTKMFGWKD